MKKKIYHRTLVEKKWQNYWSSEKTFKTSDDPSCSKAYILDMFPYPSGAGLHVGHLVGYTATDIVSRYKKQCGFNVLHPMGWDSFGLPAEQYAVRTGTHPSITTKVNIAKFKEQLQAVGYAYDWDRELATSDAKYYKWTQWIFTKLYERGLAYQAEMQVNFCPALGTVLANEEIEAGRSKEGGHLVERRPLKQWVLKITEYADRLLEGLEKLDWPQSLKKLQQNWIGKSHGAEIYFELEGASEKIAVFTTRPDTLFGVTYLVLSPEHPLVDAVTIASQKEAMKRYQVLTEAKTDLERTELCKEKTGVFTGGYALHPITGKKLPIWVGDYVLMGYGTGAVMAVPWHDERDFDFAKAFDLPIEPILEPVEEPLKEESQYYRGEGRYINSHHDTLSLDGLTSLDKANAMVVKWLESHQKGKEATSYKLRDWLFARQRYWGEPIPLLYLEDGTTRALGLDELPLIPPDLTDFTPSATGESPLAKVPEWVNIQDRKTGLRAKRETNTMPQWAGSCWYYLRFVDPHNDSAPWDSKKEQYWLPVDLYVGGAEHAVLHLLYARFWHKVLYDLQLVSTDEPFQKLCNQGLVVAPSYKKSSGAYVAPEEVVEKQGKARHWETNEELVCQIEKMSKSKLNGISPDEVIEEFGTDAVRLYMMFMGPLEKEKVWNTDAISGPKRFLNRFFDMVTSEKVSEEPTKEALKLAHKLVAGVTSDIRHMLFNTAISKMMEFVNAFIPLKSYPKEALKMAVQVLAPFAPHLAEELWEHLGEKPSIVHHGWPTFDPAYLEEQKVTYVVQVNGKVRGRFELAKDATEHSVLQLAQESPHVSKFLTGAIKKVVFVPGKLLNLVTK